MVYLFTYCIKIILILSLALTLSYAAITPNGYYGYSYAPSARSFETGEFGYAINLNVKNQDFNHNLLFRPISLFEFGTTISKKPEPSIKLLIPSFQEQSKFALGATKDKFYFTGNLKLQTENAGLYFLELGGIYSKNLHTSIGAITGSANFGIFDFVVENYLYQNLYGVAVSANLKPFTAFDMPSFLEIGAGISWRRPETKEDFYWVNAQVKYGLQQDSSSTEPILYIDVSPIFDNSISFVRSNYNLRAALDIEATLVMPFGFYIVNAFAPSIANKEERLVQRDLFDRCYLLWNPDNIPAWIGGGMLNSGIYGVQGSISEPLGASRLSLLVGWTAGNIKGFNLVGEVPLIPKLSGILSNTALFAEGGYFLGEKLAFLLNLRQGSQKNYFQLGAGYEFERPSVFLEASFNFNFDIATQKERVALRLASIKHRESSPLYIFQYDYPTYQDGNDNMRLHNFPWSK